MRQLLPVPADDVDLFEAFAWNPAKHPGVRLGMVAGVDGSATDEEGWTSRLGGPADKRVLRVLRALSDGILVGAGSIRSGRYMAHKPTGEYARRRADSGRTAPAPLVVVSASLGLDWTLPVFTEAVTATLVLTCASAQRARPVPDGAVGDVIVAGDDRVDLRAGLVELDQRHGLRHVLCEGGPNLAGALFAEGLVDELCLSLAPSLVPGDTRRLVENLPARQTLEVRSLHEDHNEIFIRYAVV